MYSTKIFSGLCFFIGLVLLAVGVYMNLNNILSTGQSYKTRLGTSMNAESIDGNGALFFGILILIVSLVSNRIYIFQKKERDKRLDYPSPDSSGNPFVPGFGTKDCNE